MFKFIERENMQLSMCVCGGVVCLLHRADSFACHFHILLLLSVR